jgi:hypothetical protein
LTAPEHQAGGRRQARRNLRTATGPERAAGEYRRTKGTRQEHVDEAGEHRRKKATGQEHVDVAGEHRRTKVTRQEHVDVAGEHRRKKVTGQEHVDVTGEHRRTRGLLLARRTVRTARVPERAACAGAGDGGRIP